MAAWITPAYLDAGRRGWIWFEYAYAELVELSLNVGKFEPQFPFILPIFRSVTSRDVERTPLIKYWQRNPFRADQPPTTVEVARTLVDFYDQEGRKRAGLSP